MAPKIFFEENEINVCWNFPCQTIHPDLAKILFLIRSRNGQKAEFSGENI